MMPRAMLLCLLLSGPCAAQQWAPLDTTKPAAKLAEYVGYGWSDTQIIDGLRRWFGWNFEIPRGSRDVAIVLRRPDASVYQMEIIGQLSQ